MQNTWCNRFYFLRISLWFVFWLKDLQNCLCSSRWFDDSNFWWGFPRVENEFFQNLSRCWSLLRYFYFYNFYAETMNLFPLCQKLAILQKRLTQFKSWFSAGTVLIITAIFCSFYAEEMNSLAIPGQKLQILQNCLI